MSDQPGSTALSPLQQQIVLRHLARRLGAGEPVYAALPGAFLDAEADPQHAVRLLADAPHMRLSAALASVMRPDVLTLLRRGEEEGDLLSALRAARNAMVRQPGS